MPVVKPQILYGLIQIDGKTYPAIATDMITFTGLIDWLIPYQSTFAILCTLNVYRMSQHEFYKWFGWTQLEQFIEHQQDGTVWLRERYYFKREVDW